ncbi:MAG: DUF86 domain-containing protein [Deltaproteobacteria bacterium]|nr:DUF86 domain-containing protein [Deltaproteobacteria bacterium]
MKIDKVRMNRYMMEIVQNSSDLKNLIMDNQLKPGTIPLKAAKYILIELAEATANSLQHILAKCKGMPVSGYIDTIVKGHETGIISERLFHRLKPFMDFRNSLVHRYWKVDDNLLINNILKGHKGFFEFVEEIEKYLEKIDEEKNIP